MDNIKQLAVKMLDDLPDELMTSVISFITLIKKENTNKAFRVSEQAGFWNNPVDSETWDNIELILDEADRAAEESDVRLSHEEVFSRLRGIS